MGDFVALAVGMKMVADMEKFIGVNQVILKQALSQKKDTIERKLESSRLSQSCQAKKVRRNSSVNVD